MADDTYNQTPGFDTNAPGGGVTADPTALGSSTDFEGWDWKMIEASILGAAATTDASAGKAVADPASLSDAATRFLFVQRTLAMVAQSLRDQTKALAGDDGPWKGTAAQAFATALGAFADGVEAQAEVLSGGDAGLNDVPNQLQRNSAELALAQQRIHEIDVWYAAQAQAVGVKPMANGLIPVSQRPDIVAMMTEDMKKVLRDLTGRYSTTINAIRQPSSVTSPTGAPPTAPPTTPPPATPPPPAAPPPAAPPPAMTPPPGGGGSGAANLPPPGTSTATDFPSVAAIKEAPSAGPLTADAPAATSPFPGSGLGDVPTGGVGGLGSGGLGDGGPGDGGLGDGGLGTARAYGEPTGLGDVASGLGPEGASGLDSALNPDGPGADGLGGAGAATPFPGAAGLGGLGGLGAAGGLGAPAGSAGGVGGAADPVLKSAAPFADPSLDGLGEAGGVGDAPGLGTASPFTGDTGLGAAGLGAAGLGPAGLGGAPAGGTASDLAMPDGLATDAPAAFPGAAGLGDGLGAVGDTAAAGAGTGTSGMPMVPPMGGMGGGAAGSGAPEASDASGLVGRSAAPFAGDTSLGDPAGLTAGASPAAFPASGLGGAGSAPTGLPGLESSATPFPGSEGLGDAGTGGLDTAAGAGTATPFPGSGLDGVGGLGASTAAGSAGMPMMPPMGGMGGAGAGQNGAPEASDASGLVSRSATPFAGDTSLGDPAGLTAGAAPFPDAAAGLDGTGTGGPAGSAAPFAGSGLNGVGGLDATTGTGSSGMPMMPPTGGMGAGAGQSGAPEASDASGLVGRSAAPFAGDTSLGDPAGLSAGAAPFPDAAAGLDATGAGGLDGSGAPLPDAAAGPDATRAGALDGAAAPFPGSALDGVGGAGATTATGSAGMPMMPPMGGMGAGAGQSGAPEASDASGLVGRSAAPFAGDTSLGDPSGLSAGAAPFPHAAAGRDATGAGALDGAAAPYPGSGLDGLGAITGTGSSGMPMMPPMGGMGAGAGQNGAPEASDASGLVGRSAAPFAGDTSLGDPAGLSAGAGPVPAAIGSIPGDGLDQGAVSERADLPAAAELLGDQGWGPAGAGTAGVGTGAGMPMMPPMGGMGAGAGQNGAPEASDASGLVSRSAAPFAGDTSLGDPTGPSAGAGPAPAAVGSVPGDGLDQSAAREALDNQGWGPVAAGPAGVGTGAGMPMMPPMGGQGAPGRDGAPEASDASGLLARSTAPFGADGEAGDPAGVPSMWPGLGFSSTPTTGASTGAPWMPWGPPATGPREDEAEPGPTASSAHLREDTAAWGGEPAPDVPDDGSSWDTVGGGWWVGAPAETVSAGHGSAETGPTHAFGTWHPENTPAPAPAPLTSCAVDEPDPDPEPDEGPEPVPEPVPASAADLLGRSTSAWDEPGPGGQSSVPSRSWWSPRR